MNDGSCESIRSGLEILLTRGLRDGKAIGKEDGLFGERDLPGALADYAPLVENADDFGSDGLLGCARVLFEQDATQHSATIIELCERAVAVDRNPKAMMLFGCVHERVRLDVAAAGKWYLRAWSAGLPWGMRFYARMHWANGDYLAGGIGHILATVASPVLVLIHGCRSALK